MSSPQSNSAWKRRLKNWSDAEWLHQHEDKVLLVLTLIIGAVVGLVVAAFIYVTESLGSRMYPAGGAAWRRLAIPVAGALFTGYLLSRYFPNARGSGIPQAKAALFLRDGFITFRTVVGKFFCCSVSLASGIALGREGPSVQVGSGLASVFGRRLGLGPERIRALVPIGASAALAAAFNTPVAAVLFTLEEVMGDLHAPVLGSIVLSSATSWIVLHLLLGDEPLFHVPAYQLIHPVEFLFYAALGVVGGGVSVCFVKLLLFIRQRFMQLPKWSEWMQPAAGGLLVGVMGWFVPQVLGVGYGNVSLALNGQMALGLMALLVPLKLIATASCYGTGNAGGIFGPALFIGAMMGGAAGSVVHHLLPDYTGSVGAYALVGMGVAFAGIVRVPLTSVIMIFEMTRDYSIIVPLMISNLISFYISYHLQREPIYEALQHQDGIHLPAGARDRQGMPVVWAAVTPAEHVFSGSTTVEDAARSLDEERNAAPVVSEHGLLGMASLAQLHKHVAEGHGDWTLAQVLPAYDSSDPLTVENFPHLHVDQPLDAALRHMAQAKLNVLPVVSRTNLRNLRGVVSLSGILRAYGVTDTEEAAAPEPAHSVTRRSGAFLPTLIAATLGALLLVGFLNYYYRSERTARADRYFKAGNDLVLHDRNQEAVEQFRNALSVSRDNQDYRLALGLTLVTTGRLEEASVYLEEVLRRDPTNGRANLGLARIAARQERTADAVTCYHRAIYGVWPSDQAANQMQVRFELAAFLEKTGSKTQATAELLAILDRVPNDTAARKRVGRLLLDYGSPAQSADVFRGLVRANNRDAEAYSGLGAAEFAEERYVSAREAFHSALRWNPSDVTSQRELALCDRILELDPAVRGLDAPERYRRSAALLAAILGAVEQCLPKVGQRAEAQPLRTWADTARQLLARHPARRSYDTAAESDLSLAKELWAASQELCGAASGLDPATDRVLAALSR
ncbi:MAG: chloride channel protein, partial [Bryobacteraceae bacterium]